MAPDEDFVSCSQCGTRIDETLTLREKLGVKQKRPGHKKPIYESVGGDDLHRDTGQWNHLSREIDRLNDRYREKIVNPKTGEVIREVDEPLSEHVNRGSAKPRAPSGTRGGA